MRVLTVAPEFENYSAEELLLITDRMVSGGDCLLDPDRPGPTIG